MRDLGELRTPTARGRLYESLYLTATSPDGARALWLRHTWLNGEPTLWITWWGPDLVQTRGAGTATLTDTSSRGSLEGHAWNLSWTTGDVIPYLPAPLYDRALPRSNGALLVPNGTVTGSFDRHDLTGWTAVVGHNWGAEHAHAWEWAHGSAGEHWFDQLRVKPFAWSPWLTVATVHLDGRTRRTRVPLKAAFTVGTEVHWDYPSPKGPPKQVSNCSVATAVLEGRTFRAVVEHGA
jgi:hypothetical protein